DIIYLGVFGQSVVVFDSYKTSHDLTDQKSAIYADRTKFWMDGELMGMGRLAFIAPYANGWKTSRKLLQE
ncbi:hypothetical protein BOTBODRAFT_88302, partial [Botryobasidium botryosum FD-172 SS1]